MIEVLKNTKETFHANLKRLRKEVRGWTQEQLAEHSGVPYRTIVEAERKTVPQLRTRAKIAKALGIPETALFAEKPTQIELLSKIPADILEMLSNADDVQASIVRSVLRGLLFPSDLSVKKIER